MNFPNGCPPDVCGGGYIDSNCDIYHLFDRVPSKLINLGLPNGSSAQLIFETIDAYLGAIGSNNGPIVPISTNAIKFTGSGIGNKILTPTLVLASGTTQIASILSTGLFVPDLRDWKVKVSATDFPDYLNNKLIGSIDPSGIVSITTEIDPSGQNLVAILPDINVIALANNAEFDNALASNETFLNDLASSSYFKNALVSPNAGNIIVDLSNGLYASGGTVAGADNGLSVSGSDIQLGGSLIQNTIINFDNLYSLIFSGTPEIYAGQGSPAGNSVFEIENTYIGASKTIGILATTTGGFSNHGLIGINGNIVISGGTDADNSLKGGLYGQIFFNSGNSITLNSAPEVAYTGVVGLLTTYRTGTSVSSANIVSNGAFVGFAGDNSTIANWASLFVKGIYQAPQGAAYSGTITNYYGLYIEDLTAGLGGSVTNKYAIYQVGTSDISRFFGPVQNAGGSTQFTSDERVKENFKIFERGLNEIEQINTKTFNYTYNKNKTVTGIIAQELETVIPEAVEKVNFSTPDGKTDYTDFRMVDQTVLFYTMLNAIKDLKKLNDSLVFRVKNLEAQIGK